MPELTMPQSQAAINRNDPCPCGSGRKYKKCCLPAEAAERQKQNEFVTNSQSRKMSRAEADRIADGIMAEIQRGKTIESCAQAVFDSREPKSELIAVERVQVPRDLIKQLGEALEQEISPD